MTEPTSTEEPAAAVSPMRQRLAAAAAKSGTRTARKTTPRKTTPRKTTARPTQSRGDRASARGQHAKRIAPMIKTGSAFVSMRNPVAGAIIAGRAEAFANALDAVANEDPRVDAFLTRVAGWAGKGGAWGELSRETAVMAGGLMLASGRVPTGPAGMVLALFAGAVVEQAELDVATGVVWRELDEAYGPDHDYKPDPARVQQIVSALRAERAEKTAARADVVDEDQADEPETFHGNERATDAPGVFSGWAA